MSYEGKIDGGQEIILCQMVMKQALDKSNYTMLDDVKLDVELANSGKFNLTGSLKAEISDLAFIGENEVSISPSDTTNKADYFNYETLWHLTAKNMI